MWQYNHVFIPVFFHQRMLILGIDDAGRGPVIGPMVLAGCLMREELGVAWKQLGVKDSKQVPKLKREELAKRITKEAKAFHITITPPSEIDARLKAGMNLNRLEALKAAEIINAINSPEQRKERIRVIIDCPSPNTKAWKRVVESYVEHKQNLDILCEHKADINHIACSAGSLLAKTTRDAEIEGIKKLLGVDIGSGYASDPLTIKFLAENIQKFRNKGIFRESWQTFKTEDNKKIQRKIMDF